MSALSGNKPLLNSPVVKTIPYAVEESTRIYQGAAVCVNAAGYAVNAADTSGLQFVGIAAAEANNSSGADGDITVDVIPPHNERYQEFAASSAAQSWVGDLVCFSDNQTVALPGTTTNDICAGRVVRLLSASAVLVDITDRSASPAAA